MRTAHSCGLRCPLHPSPPPQGRPNPEEALTVVQSPARALRAERRMPREPGTPCCSEAWRRSKRAALPRRGTRSPMARPGVEGGEGVMASTARSKAKGPLTHALPPQRQGGPRSVPVVVSVRIPSSGIPRSSPNLLPSHLPPECLDLFHRFSRRPFMKKCLVCVLTHSSSLDPRPSTLDPRCPAPFSVAGQLSCWGFCAADIAGPTPSLASQDR